MSFRFAVVILACLLNLVLLAPAARASKKGVTTEYSLGLSISELFRRNNSIQGQIGMGPISIAMGGFVNPKTAAMLRYSFIQNTKEYVDGGKFRQGNHFFAFQLQYWFSEKFFIAGGPALMYDYFYSGQPASSGMGLNLRASILSLIQSDSVSLRLVAEIIGGLSPSRSYLTQAFLLEFQNF
ncbi:MAG: hypothetical protein IPJ88_02380 [Myxococcales bacterium]|nr:MAG: hypothetical protein IPJ88_02380 [Myxococcales bacterium]